jgi:hypothetical protein
MNTFSRERVNRVGQGVLNEGAKDMNDGIDVVLQYLDDFFLLANDISLSFDSRKGITKIRFSTLQLFLNCFNVTFRNRLCSQKDTFVGGRYLARVVRD